VLLGGEREDGCTDSEMSQLLPYCVKRLALIMAGDGRVCTIETQHVLEMGQYMGKVLYERQNLLLESCAVSTTDRCL
jgi:hypothetical protein